LLELTPTPILTSVPINSAPAKNSQITAAIAVVAVVIAAAVLTAVFYLRKRRNPKKSKIILV
jgi:hypothetical protein